MIKILQGFIFAVPVYITYAAMFTLGVITRVTVEAVRDGWKMIEK